MQSNHISKSPISKDDFQITIPKLTRDVLSPLEEAKLLIDLLPNKITVLCSGGVDSEVFAKLLARFGKNVSAVCYEFVYDGTVINEHDLRWVSELENTCNIVKKSLDVKKFWASDFFFKFISDYKCTSPQLPIQVFLAEEESKNEFTVLTAVHPEPKCFDSHVWIQEREKDYAVTEYLAKNENCLVSPFRSNSEMMFSMLQSSEIRNFAEFGLRDGRTRKPNQYKQWFDIDVKSRPKYHGFETFQLEDNAMRDKIWNLHKYSEVHMYIKVEDLLLNSDKDASYSTLNEVKVIYNSSHHIGNAND